MSKSDPGKLMDAVLLRIFNFVGNRWLFKRLAMGHPGAVSSVAPEIREVQ